MFKLLHYFKIKSFSIFCLLLVFSTVSQNLFAQNVTNKGTDFWVAIPGQSESANVNIAIYLLADADTRATITFNGTSKNYDLKAKEIKVENAITLAHISSYEVIENKGVHITAEKPIVVFTQIYMGLKRRISGSLILPTAALGQEYYSVNYNQPTSTIVGENIASELVVLATEDNTVVEITPTKVTKGGKPANIPFYETLNAGQVYQVQSAQDLTGSRISTAITQNTTCKKIAVFSGSTYAQFGCNTASGAENLFQQLTPVHTWGKTYVTAPFVNRQVNTLYRIVTSENNTLVKVNGNVTNIQQKGAFIEIANNTANYITADKPIAVAQYQAAQNCDTRNTNQNAPAFPGDMDMVQLNPTEQATNQITFYSAIKDNVSPVTTINQHYINVVLKAIDKNTLKLDGVLVPDGEFLSIPGSPYVYLQKNITISTGTNPVHTLEAQGNFKALAYGYGNQESYAYSAGTSLNALGRAITTSNLIAGEPAACEGEPVFFTATLPYQPSSIKWDFGDGTGEKTVSDRNSRVSPSHKYAQPGIYTVKLITVNPNNPCNTPDVTTFDFKVNPKPVSKFTLTNTCFQEATTFTDTSTPPAGSNITAWSWDFGDPASGAANSATQEKPTHIFSKPGDYVVTLTVTSGNTCTSTSTQTVTISPLPEAKFKAEAVCMGTKTVFINESTVATGTITKWAWDFGGGKTSAKQNPEFIFPQAGDKIPVTLKITSAAGCTATFTKEIVVYPKPQAQAGADVVMLRNESTTLNGTGSGTFSWSPTQGLSNAAIANPVANPEATTTYKLTVTSPQGCTAEANVTVTVLDKLAVPNAFSPNGDGVNDTWVITGLKDYPRASVEIFDRWGNKIYAGGADTVWDGSRNGKPLPMATYYYIISQNNGNKPVKGQISIVK